MRPSVHLLATLLLLGSGVARAQGPAKPATATLERAAEVPDKEKVTRSNAAVSRMRSVLTEVLGRLEEARATKDVVKLNCVNEKLTQVKGLLRISEQSDVALQEAVAKKDTTASEHEYSKVSIAKDEGRAAAERGRAVHRPARVPHRREPDGGGGSSQRPAHRGSDEPTARGRPDEPAATGEPDSLVGGAPPEGPRPTSPFTARILERPRARMV
jgi:hypothetical protein